MSRNLISRNQDLARIEAEGFDIEISNGYLLVYGIPYVNTAQKILFGTLVCKLELSGQSTVNPIEDHTLHFIGEHPCHKDGTILTAIKNTSGPIDLGNGLQVDHRFSNKFSDRKYKDYHEKILRYVTILWNEAKSIDSYVKPLSPRVRNEEESSVFHYPDTNSSRAEVGAVSAKLKAQKIVIIGLGGTGSYVLDFVAKTEVSEIHLFDDDVFLNHNAFRTPGAPDIEMLDRKFKKVEYLENIYSRMHKHIISHNHNVGDDGLAELEGINFVFVCIDKPEIKQKIFEQLILHKIPFVDVGIGINLVEGALTGSARVTLATPAMYDHLSSRVSHGSTGKNDYTQNIQIAELNALNASLAVIKWKKHLGFYHDLQKEHNSTYSLNMNKILNNETIS